MNRVASMSLKRGGSAVRTESIFADDGQLLEELLRSMTSVDLPCFFALAPPTTLQLYEQVDQILDHYTTE
jgi:hypothetical protein